MTDRWVQWFPRDRWLIAMSQGWRWPEWGGLPIAQADESHHGYWSVLLVRDEVPPP